MRMNLIHTNEEQSFTDKLRCAVSNTLQIAMNDVDLGKIILLILVVTLLQRLSY